MGRGRSGLKEKEESVYKIITGGQEVDLSNTPLVFGNKDKALTVQEREAVREFEKKTIGADEEYALLIGADGSIIADSIGGTSSSEVYIDENTLSKTKIFTHNHPEMFAGVLCGTFSDADMSTFAYFDNIQTARAGATEGTYSITKTARFDKSGFNDVVAEVTKIQDRMMDAIDANEKKFLSGQISEDVYRKNLPDIANKGVVEIHNFYLANQKKYGYTYTLEKR